MVRVLARLEECALADASLVVVVGAVAKFLKLHEPAERLDEVPIAGSYVRERAIRFKAAGHWHRRGSGELLRALNELTCEPLQIAVLPCATNRAPDRLRRRADEVAGGSLCEVVKHGVVRCAGATAQIGVGRSTATFAGKPSGVLKQPGGINHARG